MYEQPDDLMVPFCIKGYLKCSKACKDSGAPNDEALSNLRKDLDYMMYDWEDDSIYTIEIGNQAVRRSQVEKSD